MEIKYINRKTNEIEEEKVLGYKALKWLYENPLGMGLLELVFKKKLFSYVYGKLQDRTSSKKKIKSFVEDFGINMNDYLHDPNYYTSFNEFFIRELKEGARPIDSDENRLISPADGKVFAYKDININKVVQIKGIEYSLKELFGDEKLAQNYDRGVCVVIRLAPVDYHRFHFPDDGVCEKTKKIAGDYYSVNPMALQKIVELYCRNKREISLFQSKHFGDIVMVEVGATCVGSIIQTFSPFKAIKKGQEKGYFKFGGSTVIMFLEQGKVNLDGDLILNTEKGIETQVEMGMGIGSGKIG